MADLRYIVSEIHRRSIWQVLGIYLAGAWVVFQVVWTLIESLGLPRWLAPATAVLLIVELPVVLGTALVQRGVPGSEASEQGGERQTAPDTVADRPQPGSAGPVLALGPAASHLTWRRALLGGVLGFALLGMGGVGYMGMRVAGIGPAGTLIARGVVENQARLIVADLGSPPADTLTARALSEALRIDLATSPVVRVFQMDEIAATLEQMQLPPGVPFTDSVARVVAVREGVPVVLAGELVPVGRAYQITARLVDPENGTVHLTVRETAEDEGFLLGALDRLSARLRERLGESLRSVQNREPLPRVTTSSLEALRLYVQAFDHYYERSASIRLLEQAVALDSTFASAWSSLGIQLWNSGGARLEMRRALTRGFELSARLPPREQLQKRAVYYLVVESDAERAIELWKLYLDRYPGSPSEASRWNGIGVVHFLNGQWGEAHAAYRRMVEADSAYGMWRNFVQAALAVGDLEGVPRILELARTHHSDHDNIHYWAAALAYTAGDRTEARAHLERGLEATGREYYRRFLGRLDFVEGRVGAAVDRWQQPLRSASPEAAQNWALELGALEAYTLGWSDQVRGQMAVALQDPRVDGMDDPLTTANYWAALGDADRARTALAAFEEDWSRAPVWAPNTESFAVFVRGRIALAEGHVQEGLDLYREAIRRRGEIPAFVGELALAFDTLGMADSARVAYQRYLDAPNYDRLQSADPLHLARAYERLGQLHEQQGESEQAASNYALFVELWKDADPELQPRVEAARRALARLTREGA